MKDGQDESKSTLMKLFSYQGNLSIPDILILTVSFQAIKAVMSAGSGSVREKVWVSKFP